MNTIIPKKIHLIWLGDQNNLKFDPKIIRDLMPDYELKIWYEDDFDWDDLFKFDYVKKAYDAKKWAFLSDYLRLKILYEEGGIYLDTDMILLKDISKLLANKKLVLTYENKSTLNMGFVAVEKENNLFKEIKEFYEWSSYESFILGNLVWDYFVSKNLNTKLNGKKYLNSSEDIVIYEYYVAALLKKSKKEKINKNQFILHNHSISWLPKLIRKPILYLISFTQKVSFVSAWTHIMFWPIDHKLKKMIEKWETIK